MTTALAPNLNGARLLRRIVEGPQPIVLLEVEECAPLVEDLRQVVRRSGESLYLWQAASGLLSLRDGDMPVPGAKRVSDALSVVRRSMHFGVYLFDMAGERLHAPDMTALMRVARLRKGPPRRVVLMAPQLSVFAELEPLCLRLSAGEQAARPRLRDGRWVQ